jgi:hypothetical protein
VKTTARTTSIEAYGAFVMGPKLADQQRTIVAFLAKHCHRDFTRNELAEGTGLRLASVCGRVHELLAAGTIEECARRPDRITGVNAHALRLTPLQAELFAA